MKILSAESIRDADVFTIKHEPICSLDLMERAAKRWVEMARPFLSNYNSIYICAGKGNNGGDGLAIARLLLAEGSNVKALHFSEDDKFSADCKSNQERLIAKWPSNYERFNSIKSLSLLHFDGLIIDALFGTGLSKCLTGFYAAVVEHINNSGLSVLAVDLPSGLFSNKLNGDRDVIIKATITLSFQVPKLCFFLPENAKFLGEISMINIDLNQDFIANAHAIGELIDKNFISGLLKPRSKFSHKGTFGHAHIIAGSNGMAGAAILCAKACLTTGAGLVTAYLPAEGVAPMQGNCPEVMATVWKNENELFGHGQYAIGPGLGTNDLARQKLNLLLQSAQEPIVIDADGINLISKTPELLKLIPRNSILTPHPKELERLIGKTNNSIEQLERTQAFANKWKLIILIKRANTVIISPDKEPHFNSTGNPGMATAGSGDVLTGIITGFLTQGYPAFDAALLGVFFHGLAGDLAKKQYGEQALSASSIIENLGFAFKQFAV